MLKKFVLGILFLFMAFPVCAGELENALDKGNNVFLYLYSPKCKYCQMFDYNYGRLLKDYDGQYSFIRVNSSTLYGKNLMYAYRASYVPFVLLLNKSKNKSMHINPACLMEDICIETEMKQFRI